MLASLGGGRKQDVRRLDIAMDEPARVGRVEGGGQLVEQRRRPRRRQRTLRGQQAAQVGPLHVAHRDEQRPLRLAGLVDGNDVGVLDRRRQPRLAQKAGPEALVPGELGRQQLERHLASEPLLVGEEDGAHPPAAEQRLDPIAEQLSADGALEADAASIGTGQTGAFGAPGGCRECTSCSYS